MPIVFGPFHYCTSCERATPDAPETIDDQRRCTEVVIGQSAAARAGARPYQRCSVAEPSAERAKPDAPETIDYGSDSSDGYGVTALF